MRQTPIKYILNPKPALHGVGVKRLRPGEELNPFFAGDVALNLPRTLTLQGGKEVRDYRLNS